MPRKYLDETLDDLDREITALKQAELKRHRGSRYAGPGATREVLEHLAAGGTVQMGTGEPLEYGTRDFAGKGLRTVEPKAGGGGGSSLAKCIIDIATRNTADYERMPREWASKAALAEQTDLYGGYILPIEVSSDVAAIIRANTAVLKMPGITNIKPQSKEYDLPGLATGASASYVPENALIPTSGATFEIMAKAYPRALGTLLAISNWILADAASDPSIETIVRTDLAAAMSVAQDDKLLYGSNAANEPKGITTYSGLTPGPSTGADGVAPTYGFLQQIPAALRAINAPFKNPGWILNPRTIDSLLAQTDSLGHPLFAGNPELLSVDDSGMSGRLLNFPFVSTNTVPVDMSQGTSSDCSQIIFGSDWNESYYLEWEGLAIAASAEAAYSPDGGSSWVSTFQSNQTAFRPLMRHDFQLRRPNFWVVLNGILP